MSRLRSLGFSFSLLSSIAAPVSAQETASVASDATAATVSACQAEHERAKLLELEEKWLAAREAMQLCAATSCPLALRADCAAWLERLARLMPTVLVVVERDDDSGAAIVLEIDGQRVLLSDPPQPIELVPGPHRLRSTLPAHPPVELEFTLAKAEKNRLLRVRFARPATQASAARAEPAPSRPIPTATYVLAAGALVALGSSAVLLASALTSLDDARATCSPACSLDVQASIDRRLLAADLTAGAGIVLGGLAGYTFLTRPVVSVGPVASRASGAATEFAFTLGGRF